MADPSDRDQQKVSAGMAALDDAGPINWVRVRGFTGASTLVDRRGGTARWHPGYTLWSVGANGSDDDGNPVTDVVLVPAPPWPEPSAESPAATDATLGN